MLLVAAVGMAVGAVVEPALLGVAMAFTLAVAVWRFPEASLSIGAFVVLTIRPSLDAFTERRLGLGPLAASPAAVFGLAVLLICAVIGVRRASEGKALWPDKQLLRAHLWLFAAYVVAMASGLRLYGSLGAVTGLREVVRIATVLCAFLLVLWWVGAGPQRHRRGWTYLLLGLVVPVLIALWQLVTGRGNLDIAGINRLYGTFSHPNAMGLYLVPFIVFAVGGLAESRGVGRAGRIALALGATILLALTFSRTAFLVLVAALLALPVLSARHLGWRVIARGLAVILLFVAIGWLAAGDLVRERFADISFSREALDALTNQEGEAVNSLSWRLLNWAVLIATGMVHPLTGHGAAMTTVLNPLVNADTGLPFNAHNDFVRFFFEGGLLGLFLYCIYGVTLCAWALARARQAHVTAAPAAFAVAGSLLALFFLSGGTPEFGEQTALQYEVYSMLALMTVAHVPPPEGPSGHDTNS